MNETFSSAGETSCPLNFVCADLQDEKGTLIEGDTIFYFKEKARLIPYKREASTLLSFIIILLSQLENLNHNTTSEEALMPENCFSAPFSFFPTEQFSFTFKSGIVVGPYYIHSLQETLF